MWVLEIEPLEEEPVLLTAKPSLQPPAINFFILICTVFCPHVCLYVRCVSGAQGGQKSMLIPLQWEL